MDLTTTEHSSSPSLPSNTSQALCVSTAQAIPSRPQFQPPPYPPPLLTADQVQHLIQHGHLPTSLSPKLVQLHEDLQAASRELFALTNDVKQALLPATHGTELGYYHVQDEKEYVTFRHANQASTGLESLRSTIKDEALVQHIEHTITRLETVTTDLWHHTALFLHRALLDISRYLRIPPTAWDPILDGCLSLPPDLNHATPTLLRTFAYEPDRGVAAPHKDNGLLTLCVGNEKGLQVWVDDPTGPDAYGPRQSESTSTSQPNSDPSSSILTSNGTTRRGRWHDCEQPTILIGAALLLLSDGRVAAGSHRVVANARGRQSTVFALRPSVRHTVDLGAFGAEGTVEMRGFWGRIVKGRVNVNARREVREEMERERERRRRQGRGVRGRNEGVGEESVG